MARDGYAERLKVLGPLAESGLTLDRSLRLAAYSPASRRCRIIPVGKTMSTTDLLERIEALPPAKRARAEAYVEFLSQEDPAEVAEDDPTGWKALDKIVGFIKDAPPDMAERHDFYLYGMPRK